MATASVGLCIGLTTAYLQWRTAYRIPSWDEWGWIDQYREISKRGLRLSDLLEQWNEHRLVFPRLVFMLDTVWASGSDVVDRVASDLLQCLTLAVIIGMGRSALLGAPGTIMICFSAMVLLSAAQGENVYMGFQVQFVMVYSAAVAAVALAASSSGRTRDAVASGLLVASWCAATVATFSMANGIGTWFVVAAIVLRRGLWSALATVTVGFVEATVFLYDYHGVPDPDHTGFADAIANLWTCTSYMLTYLGAVLAPTDPTLARVAGCAAVLLMIWWAFRNRARFAEREPWLRFAAGVLLFVFFSGAVTAVGRFRLGDTQALSSRYLTPGAVMWSVLGIAMAIELNALLSSRSRTIVTVCLACVVAAVGVYDESLGAEVMINQTAGMAAASDAYIVGVNDERCARRGDDGHSACLVDAKLFERPQSRSLLGGWSRTGWSSRCRRFSEAGRMPAVSAPSTRKCSWGRGPAQARPSMAGLGAAPTVCLHAWWSPTLPAWWWALPDRA